MTLEETRQMGIEFERRVQTMIPEKELFEKLDTETIYSFLNQYQDKYIHDIYRNLDAIPSGTKISAHVESVLQSLLRRQWISIEAPGVIDATDNIVDPNGVEIMNTGRSVIYPLDPSFYMYVRSVSKVSKTFSFRSNKDNNNSSIRVLPNELVSQSDVWSLIETPHDTLRILRRPAAVLSNTVAPTDPYYNANILSYTDDGDPVVGGTQMNANEDTSYGNSTMVIDRKVKEKPSLTVIYDQYTWPLGIEILYYRQPKHFSLMTSTACELPLDCFDDLVTGALELYIQYASGAEANRRRQQEAMRQQARQNNDENS